MHLHQQQHQHPCLCTNKASTSSVHTPHPSIQSLQALQGLYGSPQQQQGSLPPQQHSLTTCVLCPSVLLQAAMERGLQPQMVRPQLYISSMRTELYRDVLETNGITHILQVGCGSSACPHSRCLCRPERSKHTVPHTTCLPCAAAAQTHRLALSCSPATRSTSSTCSCQSLTGRSRTSCRPSRRHSTSSMQACTEVSSLARRDVHGFVTEGLCRCALPIQIQHAMQA